MTRYLALRDHSRGELRSKLSRRYESEIVDRLLAEADDHGWLASDESVAERTVAALIRKNKSQRYIQNQLRKRHLPVVKVDQDSELESARTLLERKMGSATGLTWEQKGKAQRFLAYRGFSSQTIRKVLNGE